MPSFSIFISIVLVFMLIQEFTWTFRSGWTKSRLAKLNLLMQNSHEEDLIDHYRIDIHEPYDHIGKIASKNFYNFPMFIQNRVMSDRSKLCFFKAIQFVKKFYQNDPSIEQKVILDSGCGKGLSTILLSMKYSHRPVIGIDRASSRLFWNENNEELLISLTNDYLKTAGNGQNMTRIDSLPSNMLILSGDFVDLWILFALESSFIVEKHFLYHPNPNPKPKLVKNRFYAHSSFPALLLMGGDVRIRINWKTFCEEFLLVLSSLAEEDRQYGSLLNLPSPASTGLHVTNFQAPLSSLTQLQQEEDDDDHSLVSRDDVLTHFDRKYLKLGIPLYEVQVALTSYSLTQRREIYNKMMAMMTVKGQEKNIDDSMIDEVDDPM